MLRNRGGPAGAIGYILKDTGSDDLCRDQSRCRWAAHRAEVRRLD
jgi:hypothetical protein